MGPNTVINPLPATADPAAAGRLLRLATYASVTTAVLLILAKLVAWVMTGSVSAVQIGREAVHLLMDQELPDEQRRHIAALAGAVAGAQGVHGLRTRQSGQSLIIQLHLELDDELSLAQAHRITLEAETAIRARYPGSDITIHQDPVSLGAESDILADQEYQAPTERAR